MRAMLLRAAEIREDEQTQVFDALDEIMARLATLDALGTIRKRVADAPDRAQVGAVADQVRQAVTTLTSVESTLGSLAPAVEAMPEHITPAVSQLGERFDALLGRVDALAGRIDGMEKRLGATAHDVGTTRTELGGLRSELGRLPQNVADAVRRHLRESVTTPLAEEVSTAREALTGRVDAAEGALSSRLAEERAAVESRQAERLRAEADRVAGAVVEQVAGARSEITGELSELTSATRALDERLAALRGEMSERFDAAQAAVHDGVERMCGEVASRPDAEALTGRLREFADEITRHHREALDEAMATFAELAVTPAPVPPARTAPDHTRWSPPRRRVTARRVPSTEDTDEDALDDPDYDAE
jgi:chromosome segregation ATPase